MEREILYRGKGMFNGQWIEGYYVRIGCGWEERHYIFSGKEDAQSRYDPIYEKTQVDPDTVGQYTGLTDRNGVKIFEGDIMRFVAYGLEYVGVVTFIDGNFGILCETASPFLDHAIERHDAKAIGNIYDNPELLEVKK